MDHDYTLTISCSSSNIQKTVVVHANTELKVDATIPFNASTYTSELQTAFLKKGYNVTVDIDGMIICFKGFITQNVVSIFKVHQRLSTRIAI